MDAHGQSFSVMLCVVTDRSAEPGHLLPSCSPQAWYIPGRQHDAHREICLWERSLVILVESQEGRPSTSVCWILGSVTEWPSPSTQLPWVGLCAGLGGGISQGLVAGPSSEAQTSPDSA